MVGIASDALAAPGANNKAQHPYGEDGGRDGNGPNTGLCPADRDACEAGGEHEKERAERSPLGGDAHRADSKCVSTLSVRA
jgi:hypothetical protein